MNVKEVEAKTGITRANIRFYESKKLICPKRSENGYRNYSEEDVEELQRIKLMRLLHISIDEIRQLKDGKATLKSIMEGNVMKMKTEMDQCRISEKLSEKMIGENADYRSINAEAYLTEFEKAEEEGYTAERLKDDVIDSDGNAWCRYFARLIDLSLLITIIDFAVPEVFLNRIGEQSMAMSILWAFISGLACSVITIIIEPLFITVFKATPGKFIFGIRVEHENGNPLNYREAMKRTAGVMFHGMGLNLPVIDIVRLVISYNTYSKGEILPWDKSVMSRTDSEDMNKWRILLGILVVIAISILPL